LGGGAAERGSSEEVLPTTDGVALVKREIFGDKFDDWIYPRFYRILSHPAPCLGPCSTHVPLFIHQLSSDYTLQPLLL
jgi:hypothetical protein